MGSNAGTMKVLAGSPIAVGDPITADSNNHACSYEASKTASHFIYGIALQLRELPKKLLVEDIRVIHAGYQTGPREKGRIFWSTLYAYFARPDITKDEPSNLKRFVTPVRTEELPSVSMWKNRLNTPI